MFSANDEGRSMRWVIYKEKSTPLKKKLLRLGMYSVVESM
jgi:hypothetical protein